MKSIDESQEKKYRFRNHIDLNGNRIRRQDITQYGYHFQKLALE